MGVVRCGAMQNTYGTRRTVTLTYPSTPYEVVETPVYLPTSKGASPTFSITVDAQYMVTANIPQLFNTIVVYGGFYNENVATQTMNFELYLNGVQIATSTQSLQYQYYGTIILIDTDLIGVQAGDVIDVYAYTSHADSVTYLYKSYVCSPTRIFGSPPNIENPTPTTDGEPKSVAYKDVTFYVDTSTYYPEFTGLSPAVYQSESQGYSLATGYGSNVTLMSYFIVGYNYTEYYFYSLYSHIEEYGLYRAYRGDIYTTINFRTSLSSCPYYQRSRKVTSIVFNR